jgi:hypothetical protein
MKYFLTTKFEGQIFSEHIPVDRSYRDGLLNPKGGKTRIQPIALKHLVIVYRNHSIKVSNDS